MLEAIKNIVRECDKEAVQFGFTRREAGTAMLMGIAMAVVALVL